MMVMVLLQSCSILETPVDALLRKARDCEFSGQFAKTEALYDQAYNLNAKADRMQLSILLDKARFLLRVQNYNEAILSAKKGLQLCQSLLGPNDMLNSSFLFILASAYDNLKEYDKATMIYNHIIAFAPNSPCSKELVMLIPLIKLGDIEFKNNHLHQAFILYKRAYAIAEPAEIMCMIISYRLALCCVSMHQNIEADFYFKQALPRNAHHSAPKDIYLTYAKFLEKSGKFGSMAGAVDESAKWYAKHKEYQDWYFQRTRPGSRRRLLDIYNEQDYNLVDAIQQNAKKEQPLRRESN